MLLSTYSDNNDFIMSETNDSVGVMIILLLNAFAVRHTYGIIRHMQGLYMVYMYMCEA